MACSRCKGERIIWGKDKYGRAVSTYCPNCNRAGIAIKKEIADLKDDNRKR